MSTIFFNFGISKDVFETFTTWLSETLGQFFWNLHAYIWQSSIIDREIKNTKLKTLLHSDKEELITKIFDRCNFHGTWRSEAKREAIREALIKKNEQLSTSFREESRKICEIAVKRRMEGLSTLISEIDSLEHCDEPAIEALRAKFRGLYSPEFLWNLVLLKLNQGKLSNLKIIDSSIQDLLKTSEGKQTVWIFLSHQKFDEAQFQALQEKEQNRLAQVSQEQQVLPSQEEEKQANDVRIEISAPPSIETRQSETFTNTRDRPEATAMIKTLIMPLMDPSIGALILRLIPPNVSTLEITKFKKAGKLQKLAFTITLLEEQSTKLGQKGIDYAKSQFSNWLQQQAAKQAAKQFEIKASQWIHGSIDSETHQITFKPGSITGKMWLFEKTLSSFLYEDRNRILIGLDSMDNSSSSTCPTSWTSANLLAAFGDLEWPSSKKAAQDGKALAPQIAQVQRVGQKLESEDSEDDTLYVPKNAATRKQV